MRIKQSTIDRHRLEVDNLLSQKKWVYQSGKTFCPE